MACSTSPLTASWAMSASSVIRVSALSRCMSWVVRSSATIEVAETATAPPRPRSATAASVPSLVRTRRSCHRWVMGVLRVRGGPVRLIGTTRSDVTPWSVRTRDDHPDGRAGGVPLADAPGPSVAPRAAEVHPAATVPPGTPPPEESTVAVSADLSKYLDKDYESSDLKDILAAPAMLALSK